MDAPDPVLPDEALRLFLAARDAPCPGCGYNLRGIQEATCPECGRAIELTINRPGRGRGYLLFVLLALCWVLAAGSMNSIRTWREVRQQATPVTQWFTSVRSSYTTTISGGSTTIISRGGPGGVSVSVNGKTVQSTGPSGSGSLVWSNVASRTWVTLGWWSGLGLTALTALVVALVCRRRFDRERVPRAMIATACVLFALYAGYHAVTFARELL